MNKLKLSFGTAVLLIFLSFTFFAYLHNVTQDIYGGDSGDLVTAAVTMGVAHPPGYPLYTMLGYAITHLGLSIPAVTSVALISVVSAVLTLFVLYRICLLVTQAKVISFLAVSILSFSYLFWLYAELAEVFMLHLLLATSLLFFLLLFSKTFAYRYLYGAVLLLGLGMANHHTIVLFTFFSPILFYGNYKKLLKEWRRAVIALPFFILGLTPYIYVFFAADGSSPINWVNVQNAQDFARLFFREDYGTFAAGAFGEPPVTARLVLVKLYLVSLINSFTLPAVLIALIGVVYGMKRYARLVMYLLATFLLVGPFFVAYTGFPILNAFVQGVVERFFLSSYIIFVVFLAIGFVGVRQFLEKVFSKKEYAALILGVFFLIPLLLFYINFQKTSLSRLTLGNQLAKDILEPLPENAFLLVTGDTIIFNVVYVNSVLGIGENIDISQSGILGIRNPYYVKKYTELEKKTETPFPYILSEIVKERPVFSTFGLGEIDGYKWVPQGLVLELTPDARVPKTSEEYSQMLSHSLKNISNISTTNLKSYERNLTTASIPGTYADAYSNIAIYYAEEFSDFKKSHEYIKKAQEVDKNFSKSYYVSSRIALAEKNCVRAYDDIKQSLSLYQLEMVYYWQLYKTENECNKSPEEIVNLEEAYMALFKRDIQEDSKNFGIYNK